MSSPTPGGPPNTPEILWEKLSLGLKNLSLRARILGGIGLLFLCILLVWGSVSFFGGGAASQGKTPVAAGDDKKQVQAAGAGDGKAGGAEVQSPASPAQGAGALGWVPVYPGSAPEVASSAQTPDGDQRVSTFKTSDGPPKVISYFQDQLRSQAFNVTMASSGEQAGMLQAQDTEKKRSIIVSVNASADGTQARVVTVERK
jgi:hypothetical protein